MRITTLTNPRQTVLITSRFGDKDNVMTADWHTPLSFEPMMYAVSIGKTRYSLELIKKSGVFVVNFMPKEYEKEILYCGRHSGQKIDKFQETKLTKEEAETINCPRIKEALAYLECQVEKAVEVGDHILFIAKVSKSELRRQGKRLFHLFNDQFTTTER